MSTVPERRRPAGLVRRSLQADAPLRCRRLANTDRAASTSEADTLGPGRKMTGNPSTASICSVTSASQSAATSIYRHIKHDRNAALDHGLDRRQVPERGPAFRKPAPIRHVIGNNRCRPCRSQSNRRPGEADLPSCLGCPPDPPRASRHADQSSLIVGRASLQQPDRALIAAGVRRSRSGASARSEVGPLCRRHLDEACGSMCTL